MGVYKLMEYLINEVPDYLRKQELCNKGMFIYPYLLEHDTDHLKTREMYNEAVCRESYTLWHVPD